MTRRMSSTEFRNARQIVIDSDAVFSGNADTIFCAVASICRIVSGLGGLLVKRDIVDLIAASSLLTDADPENIRPASYDLRLGDQVWCQGRLVELSDHTPTITVPSYSYAIVIARENAALPRFITGRFDVKVSLFLGGIILSNGPQVDPGYRGMLFCMLFNGSSRPRLLARGAHFATIEFTTTTEPTTPYRQQYQLQARLEQIMTEDALGGPGGTILETIDGRFSGLHRQIQDVRNSYWSVVAVIVAIVAIPAALLLYILWDKDKEAETIVNRMRDAERGVLVDVARERDEATRAVRDAAIRAMQDMNRKPVNP